MFNHLSRVFWSMGQALLPAHLRALEVSLLADSALRFSMQQKAPNYGFSKLQWNKNLLNEGILAVDVMTLVFASGLLIDLKANATVKPLNLNLSGKNLVSVYIHIRTLDEESNFEKSNQRITKRDGIDCWMWSLELSTEQEHPDTLESFCLAEFEKLPDGLWQYSKTYIPPLISLGAVPFLKEELMALMNKFEAYHHQLNQEIAVIYLSGSDLINAKQCLKSVVQTQRFLANLLFQISPHPYEVYEKLKYFYVDLCFYHNEEPQYALTPYRHDHLFDVFNEILIPLGEQLKLNQTRSPYLSFVVSENLVQASLPVAIREAKNIYLLVQKSNITQLFSLDNFKIASISRLPIVHKFYLQGIPFKRLERPPFQHSFGPEVDIYQLTIGEEWDNALIELSIGFYVNPQLMSAKYFLHWR